MILVDTLNRISGSTRSRQIGGSTRAAIEGSVIRTFRTDSRTGRNGRPVAEVNIHITDFGIRQTA